MSRILRSFREMLGLLSRGEFSRRLDEELSNAVEALEEMPADKGKAVITVQVVLNYELGRIDVDPSVKVKLPETARFMKTPFWALDGQLSVEHPNQIDMFPGPRRQAEAGDEAEAPGETAAS